MSEPFEVAHNICYLLFFLQRIEITDCGELMPGDDDGMAIRDDGTGDAFPDYPEDADFDITDVSICVFFLVTWF